MGDPSSSTPVVPPVARYAYLPRLGGGGVQLELHGQALHWSVGPRTGVLALADVQRVRLFFQHAKFAASSYDMQIEGRDGTRLTLSSASRVSLSRVENQSADYAAFVRAFHEAMAGSAARQVAYIGGYGRWRWNIMAFLGGVTCLALLAVVAMEAQDGAWLFSGLVALFGLVLAWPMAEALWRNQPAQYVPQNLPPYLLPA
ncbi:hypothetical protein ACT6QH_09395 [Xanthobacter sp. TB0139]|uniref:hypothetical protein n=1 Tax=Xanthobacter sp. TB0139 TaxID=3459178 RepID=UPI00403A32BA